jgi:hypothetical protein
MSKFVTFLGALLLAHSHNLVDFDRLCAEFPIDPLVTALRMLLQVYVPLAFLTMAVVRMSASQRQQDRQRAFTVLHEEILPQMVVHFRTLGSPEYSKVCLEYYTRLNYWKEHRPDLYAMFAENGARVLNEVSIELIHAWVACHFVMVQMAYSDYRQSAEAFCTRSPMMTLQRTFNHLACIEKKDYGTNSAYNQLAEDAAAVGKSLRKLLHHVRQTAPDRVIQETSSAHGLEQSLYDEFVGALTPCMFVPRHVDHIINEARDGIMRDLASPANAAMVNETLTSWKKLFYNEDATAWRMRPVTELTNYFEGKWLPTYIEGTTRKIIRLATAAQASEATAWEAPMQGQLISIESFADIKEIIEDWINALPQPTRAYRSRKEMQSPTPAPSTADETDTYSVSSDETRIDPEDLLVSNNSDREHGDLPPRYGRMPDITICTVTFRDERLLMRERPIKVTVGLDHYATARNIMNDMQADLQANFEDLPTKRSRGTPDEFNQGELPKTRPAAIDPATPVVVCVRCGDFSAHAEAGDPNPEQATTIALHRYIRDHVSVQYDSALDALAACDWPQAIYIANAVLRDCGHLDARGLNLDWTNRALTMGIVAIATVAQGVEILNSDSMDDPIVRSQAIELLCEAKDVVNECLEGSTVVERWISAGARDGAGVTMHKKLANRA